MQMYHMGSYSTGQITRTFTEQKSAKQIWNKVRQQIMF